MTRNIASVSLSFALPAVLGLALSSASYAQNPQRVQNGPTKAYCEAQRTNDLRIAQQNHDDQIKLTPSSMGHTRALIDAQLQMRKTAIENQYKACMTKVGLYNNKPPLDNSAYGRQPGGNTTGRTSRQQPWSTAPIRMPRLH